MYFGFLILFKKSKVLSKNTWIIALFLRSEILKKSVLILVGLSVKECKGLVKKYKLVIEALCLVTNDLCTCLLKAVTKRLVAFNPIPFGKKI